VHWRTLTYQSDLYAGRVNAASFEPADELTEHRALIDACLRHRVPFTWHGPGALLIESRAIGVILRDVAAEGFKVLGIEGFDVDPSIRPRLDLILDNTAGHPYRDPAVEGQTWGDEIWIDVTIARDAEAR
jgi:hypothetical protein